MTRRDELAKPVGQRRPYTYEGDPQWAIDVANNGITHVRAFEREKERAIVEHEALGPLGIKDLLEAGDLDHPDGCHGCWAMWADEAHPDWQHSLTCHDRPCGDVDSHLMIDPDTKAGLIFDGAVGGFILGTPFGIALGALATVVGQRIW
jgi:hypothetical protein